MVWVEKVINRYTIVVQLERLEVKGKDTLKIFGGVSVPVLSHLYYGCKTSSDLHVEEGEG